MWATPGEHHEELTHRLLETASASGRFCVLGGNHQSVDNAANKPFLCGWGMLDSIEINQRADLEHLNHFLEKYMGKWIFGHCCYETGFLLEPHFESVAPKADGFSTASFFLPRYVAEPTATGYRIWDQTQDKDLDPEAVLSKAKRSSPSPRPVDMHDPPDKSAYIETVQHLIHHLNRGDIYEINYCIPFRSSGRLENPLQTWIKLHNRQQTPFGALYREGKNWLLCGSPERFMRKDGMRLKSEPIKGTAPRGATPEQDALNREALRQSEKERAENVMIVDLVRNDLGRIAETGSVHVDELCGIYSFPGVHQMISTVSGTLRPE
ncbi:MAG: chorismate-binding protein, partial [Bacteroidota bacterium]